MKILYAVQATGNGHISRAMELLPYLERYGSVDIFLSGANSSLEMDAPVKFRSKGISLFYTCTGRLSYSKMIRNISPWKIIKEINDLPKLLFEMKKEQKRMVENLKNWSENDLDINVMPHPIIGKISVREMLFFTIYHIQHHAKSIQKMG